VIRGKLEKELVEPYMPNKIVPPEYIRDVLEAANKDFPLIDWEYIVPHTMTNEEYIKRYEELERQMIEILKWRIRWFGKSDVRETKPKNPQT
jgi:hypothetical protein